MVERVGVFVVVVEDFVRMFQLWDAGLKNIISEIEHHPEFVVKSGGLF